MVSRKKNTVLRENFALFEIKSGDDYVDLLKYITSKGVSLAATRTLYFRMMAKALDSSNDIQRWILQPEHGVSRTKSVEDWIIKTGEIHMNSADLLNIFAASTLRTSLKQLLSSGLIEIDIYNRMHVKYPVDGKMLSLGYAVKAIKSKLKKTVSLDKPDTNKVGSDKSNIKPMVSNNNNDDVRGFDENYWEED